LAVKLVTASSIPPSVPQMFWAFNFFTTREYGAESWEPPFEVLRDLGNPEPSP